MKTYFKTTKAFILGIIISIGGSYAYAAVWTGPTASAPGNNTEAPINVSVISQVKAGALSIGGEFKASSDVVFDMHKDCTSLSTDSNGKILCDVLPPSPPPPSVTAIALGGSTKIKISKNDCPVGTVLGSKGEYDSDNGDWMIRNVYCTIFPAASSASINVAAKVEVPFNVGVGTVVYNCPSDSVVVSWKWDSSGDNYVKSLFCAPVVDGYLADTTFVTMPTTGGVFDPYACGDDDSVVTGMKRKHGGDDRVTEVYCAHIFEK